METSNMRPLILCLCCSVLLLPSTVQALYGANSPVVSLDGSNLKSKIKESGIALVEFYAPWCGHCKSLQPEYEKVAKALKGMILIAAVDADQHKDVAADYQIQGFPTIKLMYMDGGKLKKVDYQGGRTAKDMINYVMDKAKVNKQKGDITTTAISYLENLDANIKNNILSEHDKSFALKRVGEKGSGSASSGASGSKAGGAGSGAGAGGDSFYSGTDVTVLTDSNFSNEVIDSQDLWLVEFYAPWCGHCKNLKPAWIEAAGDLKGKVKVGAVDCTQHQSTCSEYGVQGYPTLKFFGKNKRSPQEYDGPREAAGIVDWATAKWSKVAPAPEVRELTDASIWESECVGDDSGKKAKQLCFLAFLPDILDSKAVGRNGYIAALKKLAEKFKDKNYSWLWVQGGAQADLETSVGVGGFGYPALVAYKPGDAKYSIAREAFELKHMTGFVEGLPKGKSSVLSVQGGAPKIKSIKAWDGKDAQVVLEDEFSLDDLNEL